VVNKAGGNIAVGAIVEMGYVVHDIEAAARKLNETTGAGPFFVYEDIQMHNVCYRGQEVSIPIDIAMGASGDLVIELIRVRDGTASPFQVPDIASREMVFNHWSVFVSDFELEANRLIASGFTEILSAEIAGGAEQSNARLAYFETPGLSGTYYEIMEASPSHLLQSYQRVIDAGKAQIGNNASLIWSEGQA
jgi:hypothetical protein